jgi:ribosomal protein L3
MSQKGILGRKLGMTQVFDEANRVVPVSVVEAGPCRVVQLKTPERDGYTAVQLAFGDIKASRLNKPELGHLKAAGGNAAAVPRRAARRRSSNFELGQVIAADVFAAGRPGRRHRHQQGQRLHRCDEAPQLLRPGRVARQPQEAPLARARSARAHAGSRCSRA